MYLRLFLKRKTCEGVVQMLCEGFRKVAISINRQMGGYKVKICDLKIYKGRNIYSHKPVIKMTVDVEEYGNIPTKDIEGFNEKLL